MTAGQPLARRADGILARAGVRDVLDLLDRDGEQARVVGGAVRNHLMGLPIADIDIATTALPDTVLARARAARIHAVPTGYDHGTVTLIAAGVAHEVTTLREDIETDGRRAVVRFGRDFRADALRRDFTINALSLGRDGAVHDYAGGLDDLAIRRVRFIGDADQRIREDYLRILRLFRFSAAYGGGLIDADGLAAAIRNRAGLAALSRERVRQETMKLLVACDAVPVVAAMAASGLIEPVLEGVGDISAFARMAACESAAAMAPSAVRRLMALAVRQPEDVARLRQCLKLTNGEQGWMERLVAARAEMDAAQTEPALKIMLYRLGADLYRDAVLDRAVRGVGSDWRGALTLPERWIAPVFQLGGHDVMALGVARGPQVGSVLAEAEAAWIAAGMPGSVDAQQALLAETVIRPR